MRVTINQNGFALVKFVLLLVIVGLLVGTGYYVWRVNTAARDSYAKAGQSQESETTSTEQPAVEKPCALGSKTGTPYSAPDGSYGICLANGWVLHRYMNSAALYAFGTDGVHYRADTKAKVVVDTDGKDGSGVGLFINGGDAADMAVPMGVKQTSFETNAKANVDVYYYAQTTEPEEGLGALPKSGVLYTYRVQDGDRVASVAYGLGPNDVSERDVVEAAVRSIVFFE